MTTLAQGAGEDASPPFTSGTTSHGVAGYRGYCPPAGDAEHHYMMTVYALDLLPGALPGALEREALLGAMSGHILRRASIVGRYHR